MKNQLTVIQAMAAQTARRSDSVKQFQDQFFRRLQGLAVSTDLLVLQSGSGVPLKNLIQRQLEPFAPSTDRLECDGPNLLLGPEAAQTIGLALHELATNALKYGAWSLPGGRVSVNWSFVANGSTERRFRVGWLEQGGPVVVPPTRKGFGHVVINVIAPQRVNGEADLLYSPDGLSWTFTMPTSNIITLDTLA
jgi:two-component sensor histidine kinase